MVMGKAKESEPYDASRHLQRGRASWSTRALGAETGGVGGGAVELEKLAKLAQLELAEGGQAAQQHGKVSREELERSVASMIQWTRHVSRLDVGDLEPTYSPLQRFEFGREGEDGQGVHVRLRKDEVTSAAHGKELLARAGHADRGHFIVPKVVDYEDS